MLNLSLRYQPVALAAAVLMACTDDSQPLGPEAPGGMEAAPSPTASIKGWASSAPMPTKRLGLVAASVNGVIYTIGGQTEFLAGDALLTGAKVTKVEAYNPATGAWTTKTPLPAKRAFSSGAAVIGGKIYVAGGLNANGIPTKTLWVYNPSNNSWSSKAPVPVATANGGAAVIGGKLYVMTPKGTTTQLHRYDPSTDTWLTRATAPRGHHLPAYGVIDGKLYVAGTVNSDKTPMYGTSVYNPGNNTWAERAFMPGAHIGAGSGVLNGQLYVVAGAIMPGIGESSVVKLYNPPTNSWVEPQWLPLARSYLAATTVNGVLYAFGGQVFGEVVASAYMYTP